MTESVKVKLSSGVKDGINLTFSSSTEIESYIRGRVGQPGYSESGKSNLLTRKTFDGTFTTMDGVDICEQVTISQ